MFEIRKLQSVCKSCGKEISISYVNINTGQFIDHADNSELISEDTVERICSKCREDNVDGIIDLVRDEMGGRV